MLAVLADLADPGMIQPLDDGGLATEPRHLRRRAAHEPGEDLDRHGSARLVAREVDRALAAACQEASKLVATECDGARIGARNAGIRTRLLGQPAARDPGVLGGDQRRMIGPPRLILVAGLRASGLPIIQELPQEGIEHSLVHRPAGAGRRGLPEIHVRGRHESPIVVGVISLATTRLVARPGRERVLAFEDDQRQMSAHSSSTSAMPAGRWLNHGVVRGVSEPTPTAATGASALASQNGSRSLTAHQRVRYLDRATNS